MGTILAEAAIERVQTLLVDRGGRRWVATEILQWLGDAQLAVVQLRPDAYTVRRVVPLVPGTHQTLPAEALRLLDVPRNMGPDGQTPGMACRFIDRKQLDLSDPYWHEAPASSTAVHWMYDQQTPKDWWCYPPQPAENPGQVQMHFSAVPPAPRVAKLNGAEKSTPLALDDVWLNPILEFTVYRAFSKDDEYTQVGGKADIALRAFLQMMGLDTETAKRFNPPRNQPPRYSAPPKSDAQGAFGPP